MSDRVFFSIAALAAILLVALAAVWPQGFGARSPGPFGHPVIQTAEAQHAAQARAAATRIAANPKAAALIGLRSGK